MKRSDRNSFTKDISARYHGERGREPAPLKETGSSIGKLKFVANLRQGFVTRIGSKGFWAMACKPLAGQHGALLVVTIAILAVLSIIGVAAITTTRVETDIATNYHLHKKSFYGAEGGTEIGREILEQNLACPMGFDNDYLMIGAAEVIDKDFWKQTTAPEPPFPADDERDVRFPADDDEPHTNLVIFGITKLSTGSAIQMAAGYEGKGKGAGGGGAYLSYNIYSRHHRPKRNSQACLQTHYKHMIGQEAICQY